MWKIIKCAVTGQSHKQSNTPCQDKVCSLVKNEVCVLCLCDGAGSARLSHFGARLVASRVCVLLSKNFDEYFALNEADLKAKILKILLEKLQKKAEFLHCKISDLASTLLFVAIKKDKFILAHIGDGLIACLKNETLSVLSAPQNGEFINTTTFITSPNALDEMHILRENLAYINAFVLMSDGSEAGLYDKREKSLAPVLKDIMQKLKAQDEKFMQSKLLRSFEDVMVQKTTDDCSIIIAVKL